MPSPHLTRRSLLRTVPLVGAVPLAGCSSIYGESVRICQVGFMNQDDVAHRFQFELLRSGETVLERDYRAGPASRKETTGETYVEALPDDAGDYVIRGRVNNRDWNEERLADLFDEAGMVYFRVRQDGRFSLFYSGECEPTSQVSPTPE